MLLKIVNTNPCTIYSNPTNKALTNTIIDAVDSAVTAQALYPHAYTATLKSTFDTAVFHNTDNTLTLDLGNKYACGVFLSNAVSKGQLFHVTGSIKMMKETANTGLNAFFTFGQCDASTVTQSDAGASNLLSNYIVLPQGNNRWNAPSAISALYYEFFSIDTHVYLDNSPENTDPICFAAVLENHSGVACGLEMMHIYLSIRSATAPLTIDTAYGV